MSTSLDRAALVPAAETAAMRVADRVRLASLRALGFRSRTLASPVGDMHVLEGTGSGPIPNLVLLHGLAASAVDWGPLLRRARTIARRIIAPDLPGHGRSDPPGVEDLLALQDGLDAVLDELTRPEPALIYANSMGGVVGVRYAVSRPQRVGGLVLASPAGARTSPEELDAILGEFRRAASSNDARRFLDRVMPGGHWMGPALEFGVRVRLRNPYVQALAERVSNDHTLEPEELRNLRVPVLLSWGRRERLLPPSHLAFYQEHLPEHAIIEEPLRHGHMGFMDDPSGVAGRLLRFWDEHVR